VQTAAWDLVSIGYRNCYDLAFNDDGELLTYDADVEFDVGTPWYRPPRVCQVTSGSDYGWRADTGPWPRYFIDSLPPVAEGPPGSPTGLAFAYESAFPKSYKYALFAGDWSCGNIYAVRLKPYGASYRGRIEPFATNCRGVTDLLFRPQDGALYLTVGGRRTQSALYRIVWERGELATSGDDTDDQIDPSQFGIENYEDRAPLGDGVAASVARRTRRSLEELHLTSDTESLDKIWKYLGDSDRFVSTAARIALEHRSALIWMKRLLMESDVQRRSQALVALAHRGDLQALPDWEKAIISLEFGRLTEWEQLQILRAVELGIIRLSRLADSSGTQSA
jgi:hypothetical protein